MPHTILENNFWNLKCNLPQEREGDKNSVRIYITYAIYMKPSKSDSKMKKTYKESYNCWDKTKIVGKTNIASTVPLYFTNITTSFIPAIPSWNATVQYHLIMTPRLKLSCTAKVGGFRGHLLRSKNGEYKFDLQRWTMKSLYKQACITEKFNSQIWIVHCDHSLI